MTATTMQRANAFCSGLSAFVALRDLVQQSFGAALVCGILSAVFWFASED